MSRAWSEWFQVTSTHLIWQGMSTLYLRPRRSWDAMLNPWRSKSGQVPARSLFSKANLDCLAISLSQFPIWTPLSMILDFFCLEGRPLIFWGLAMGWPSQITTLCLPIHCRHVSLCCWSASSMFVHEVGWRVFPSDVVQVTHATGLEQQT